MTVPAGEIRYMWNGDEIKTGTTAAIADLNALATATDTAAADINTGLTDIGTTATTELGTTVPAAVDSGAVGLTTKVSKFKAVGTELGTSLSQGIAGGVDPATSAVNVGSSLSGLLAATATTGIGIAAAVGLSLGVAVVGNIVKGIKAEEEELKKQMAELAVAFREGLGKLDKAARESQLTGLWDDPDSALNKVTSLVADVNEALQSVGGQPLPPGTVEAMFVGTPAQRAKATNVYESWIADAQPKLAKLGDSAGVFFEKIGIANGRLQEQGVLLKGAKDTALDQLRIMSDLGLLTRSQEKDYAKILSHTAGTAEHLGHIAADTALAADAAERLGFALGNAARQAGTIAGLDLGS